ncbi:hypothetical protein FKR81_32395 [Lentzea tibetensis]|uniref:Uncharacterized protein n=1 Tax=Lentzea tibetensis TaxID=2591470 RepID=A0A563EK57_9PSEU|nr:hypothetical protein [Lentzea tibetensis]TWP47416.1 hypothetical protein FKR81_32395 [Lentzea tibetensis]
MTNVPRPVAAEEPCPLSGRRQAAAALSNSLAQFAELVELYEAKPEKHAATRVRLFGLLSVGSRVYRVLWLVATGINRPFLLEWHAEPCALELAIDARLVAAPLSEEFPYLITDAGRHTINWWYQLISPRREHRDFKPFWEAVTLR